MDLFLSESEEKANHAENDFLRKKRRRQSDRKPERRKKKTENQRRLRARSSEFRERERVYYKEYNRKKRESDPEFQKRKSEREFKKIQAEVKARILELVRSDIRQFRKCLRNQPEEVEKRKQKARDAARIRAKENSKVINEKTKHRHRTDPAFRLRRNLRTGLRNALKNGKKSVRTFEIIGCSPSELLRQFERTIPKRFTMQDFLNGKLHIDHIIPLAAFDQSDMNQVRLAWNWQNLRLIPAKENRLKHARIVDSQLPLCIAL